MGYLSIGNENEHFSDSELSKYAQIVLDFQCSVRGLPKHNITNQQIFTNGLIENDYTPIYKYLQPEVFNKYIEKGKWQLGCIQQYRTLKIKSKAMNLKGIRL